MKPQSLTQTLLAALLLTSAAKASPALRSKISAKEKQIAALQSEITSLKKQLTSSSANRYSVKAGDTLSSIARRHGISPDKLAKVNQISDPSRLIVGQTLIIQSSSRKTPLQTVSGPKSNYVVKKGDTFYGIARRNGLSVNDLQKLNPGVTASHIARGQKLVVSGKMTSTAVAKVTRKSRKNVSSAQLISAPKKKAAPKAAPVEKKAAPKAKPQTKPAPKPKAKVELSPIPTPVVKETPKPKPQVEAPAPPVVEEQIPSPSGVTSIILTSEMTFEDFAGKHNTSTAKLNELNGWNLPKSTTLARGSEIYIPK